MTDHNASLPPPRLAKWPAPRSERRAASSPRPSQASVPGAAAPVARAAKQKPGRQYKREQKRQRKQLEHERKQQRKQLEHEQKQQQKQLEQEQKQQRAELKRQRREQKRQYKRAKGRGLLRASLVVGFLVFAALAVVGGVIVGARPQEYAAESSVVILPLPVSDRATEAGLFETLSRGQIVETFAELTRNQRFAAQAKTALQLTPAERKGAWVEVSTVPSTSIVLIRAHARDPRTAERVADKTMELATGYFATLPQPFRTDRVDTAEGSAQRSGQSKALLLAAVIATAFAAGLAIQQASYQLLQASRARRAAAASAEVPSTRSPGAPTA